MKHSERASCINDIIGGAEGCSRWQGRTILHHIGNSVIQLLPVSIELLYPPQMLLPVGKNGKSLEEMGMGCANLAQ